MIKAFFKDPANVRKSIAALIASILLLVGVKALPAQLGVWIQGFQPLLVAWGVWKVPNTDPAPEEVPQEGV